MSGKNRHMKNQWAVSAYEAYLRCCAQRGVGNPPQFAQNHLGFAPNQWSNFRSCEVILGDPSLYASLFIWGVQEADPRTIPDRIFSPRQSEQKVTRKRAWAEDEWQAWLTSNEAKRIATLNPQPFPNDSWEVNLARDLADLCSSMGWGSPEDMDDLRESLGISAEHWEVIVSGAKIIDAPNDGNPYTHLYFGLGIGDPRTLPKMDVTNPKGRFVRQRQWTESRLIFWERKMGMDDVRGDGEWIKWWESVEERYYAWAKTSAVVLPIPAALAPIQPDVVSTPTPSFLEAREEVPVPVRSSAAVPFSFEAVLATLGEHMDSTTRQQADQHAALVAAFQQELKNALGEVVAHVMNQAEEARREFRRLLQEQLDGIIEQLRAAIQQDLEPIRQQIRELSEQKVDRPDTVQLAAILQAMADKLDSLGVSGQAPEKSAPKQQRDKMREIAVLARQLTALLQEFWGAKEQDRDHLVRTNGQLLGTLLTILDPLTLPADKRERSIELAKEVNGS